MNNNTIPYKLLLTENEIPTRWYNLRADMKNKPAPLLNPETHKPMTFEELRRVFCDELARQELDDTTPYIDTPRPSGIFTVCSVRRRSSAPTIWKKP